MKAGRMLCLGMLAMTVLSPMAAGAEDQAPAGLAIGDAVPMAETKMKNVDGKEVSIAEVAGKKGTMVVFTCNACPWAQAWEKRITTIGNNWSKRGIGVIAINPNDPGKVADDDFTPMQARAKKLGMKFPYAVDATSGIARAFGASRTPEVYLFDAQGKLVYHGTIDDNAKQPTKVTKRYLENALKAVSAGQQVAESETKALGCSIKLRGK